MAYVVLLWNVIAAIFVWYTTL